MKKILTAVAFALVVVAASGCGQVFGCPAGEWDTGYGTCCPNNFPFYYGGQCWQFNYSKANPPPSDALKATPTEQTEQQK